MQKKQFLAVALVTLGALTLFSGCQSQPQGRAEDVIKEGIARLAGLTSYSYDLAMKVDINDPAGQGGKFDVKLNGALDIKDAKDPKFTVKFDGSGSDSQGTGGSGSLDLNFNKEAVFFNVAKLEMTGGEAVPKEITDMFSKWWKITLPTGAASEITSSIPQGSQEEMTPQQKQLRQLFEDSNVLSRPSYVGMDSVMGENSYHYSVTVDKDNLVAFMKKASELQGTTVTETNVADSKKSLDKIDFKADVWVGSTSLVLNKASVDLKLNGSADEANGTVSFTGMLGNLNKPVSFEAPKDATEFPVEQFLAPFMMNSGAMGGTEEMGFGTEQMGIDAGSMDGFGSQEMGMDGSSMDVDNMGGMDASVMMDTNVDDVMPLSSDTQE